jgi:hypothetical protein
MNIIDQVMLRKMNRALKLGLELYTFGDIEEGLESGDLQGHVKGDTWAITQVQSYPNRKVVNILFCIGSIEGSIALESDISEWAKGQGATLLTAIGREGWWEHRTPGWIKSGVLYSKEL